MYALEAQLVEQRTWVCNSMAEYLTFNQGVVGSNPTRPIFKIKESRAANGLVEKVNLKYGTNF